MSGEEIECKMKEDEVERKGRIGRKDNEEEEGKEREGDSRIGEKMIIIVIKMISNNIIKNIVR